MTGAAGPRRRIAYVLTWHTGNSTFIMREIETLHKLGIDLIVFTLKPPDAAARGGSAEIVTTGVVGARNLAAVALETLRAPGRALGTLLVALDDCGLRPVETARAVAAFIAGCRLAREVRKEGSPRIHAHWATVSASVAWVASRLTCVPFSFTGHAWDLFTPDPLRRRKIRDAACVITCTEFTRRLLVSKFPDAAGRIHTVHHGVEEAPEPIAGKRGAGDAPLILAVGRLMEKKGFDRLLAACRKLSDQGATYRLRIIGPEGGEGPALARAIRDLGLEAFASLEGVMKQDDLARIYPTARVLVAPSVEDRDGIMDGIPNVILEAMSHGLPVVASRISGIPEAVEDGVTGFLVPPGDTDALAGRIGQLLAEPGRAERMGIEGRRKVTAEFGLEVSAAALAGLLAGAPPPMARPRAQGPLARA